jgi:hypothetical protein
MVARVFKSKTENKTVHVAKIGLATWIVTWFFRTSWDGGAAVSSVILTQDQCDVLARHEEFVPSGYEEVTDA